MTEPARKPLAHVTAEGRGETMVVKPTRWPQKFWDRMEERARARRVGVSEVVRDCAIAGLSMLEAHEAMQSHKGKTA